MCAKSLPSNSNSETVFVGVAKQGMEATRSKEEQSQTEAEAQVVKGWKGKMEKPGEGVRRRRKLHVSNRKSDTQSAETES